MNNVLPSSSTGNDESRMMNDEQGTSNAMRGGFSIMEVLVAVMIIGVLAVILVPVLTSRAREARVAACESELRELAEAQKSVAIQTGYFLRLYALDDLPGSAAIAAGGTADVSRIVDEGFNTFVSNPKFMFIDPTTNSPLSAALADAQFNKILLESMYGWKGPFCNFKRDEKPNESWPTPGMGTGGWTLPTHIHGIPNDPWGNDYLLFVRQGLIPEPNGYPVVPVVSVDAIDYSTVVFDRPTILSLGPNGKPGDGTAVSKFGEGDDIYRSFEY
jgi:prepilin-type N-terminal cleavage/methylation domain-containing protein